ncbi:MAG: hypothetical protein A2X45_02135 [Lentisphaerae bacterium GWF2_50_93]|nr:MAG: hypothetical protein A2X45_02135 [Lentisphaerae bacterium GWF2_50_93]
MVDKTKLPPSGLKNDYVSMAPYWWPDPQKPDGLPYIRRDGETNPEHYNTDRTQLEHLCDAVSCLTIQSFVSENEIHASHVGRLLRCWFLEPSTMMNPHLRYAQYIPGRCEGRGLGLIDTMNLCHMLDMVSHLPFSKSWTQNDLSGLKDWVGSYLEWFLKSEHGQTECREFNNHGTWYDTQVVCFAVFCGQDKIARDQIENHVYPRISSQIEPDGSQPHELARTLSMSYCTFNLTGFAILSRLSRQMGIDLWGWKTADGRGILPAIRWMLPYYMGRKNWNWTQLNEFPPSKAAFLLSLAAEDTQDGEIIEAAGKLAEFPWSKISAWRTGVREFNNKS